MGKNEIKEPKCKCGPTWHAIMAKIALQNYQHHLKVIRQLRVTILGFIVKWFMQLTLDKLGVGGYVDFFHVSLDSQP